MERLTEKLSDGNYSGLGCNTNCRSCSYTEDCVMLGEIINHLGQYEDTREQKSNDLICREDALSAIIKVLNEYFKLSPVSFSGHYSELKKNILDAIESIPIALNKNDIVSQLEELGCSGCWHADDLRAIIQSA